MKTSKELRELRGSINEELTALEKGFEGVEPTAEQRSAYEAKLKEVEKLTSDIDFAERAEKSKAERSAQAVGGVVVGGGEEKEKETMSRNFDIAKAIKLVRSHRELDGLEGEMRQAAESELREFGAGVGDIALPSWAIGMTKRTDIDQATSAIAPTNVGRYAEALREGALWDKAGVEMIEGLTGDFKIPIVGKQSVGWSTENGAAADGGTNYTSKTLSPKRTTGYVDISNKVLLQNGKIAQDLVMTDLGRATAQLWNTAMFGTPNVSNAPGSIPATSGVVALTPTATYAAFTSVKTDIMNAEQALLDAEVLTGSNVRFILATNLLADLRQSATVSSVSPTMTTEGMRKFLLGYEAFFTVANTKIAATSGNFLAGDFSYVKMGTFGGMNITVDNLTQALNDQVRLVLHRYVDWVVTQPTAFVKCVSKVA